MTALERNEEKRWSTMTKDQLRTRLEKITNPKKIDLFIVYAKLYGDYDLMREARSKLRFFRNIGLMM